MTTKCILVAEKHCDGKLRWTIAGDDSNCDGFLSRAMLAICFPGLSLRFLCREAGELQLKSGGVHHSEVFARGQSNLVAPAQWPKIVVQNRDFRNICCIFKEKLQNKEFTPLSSVRTDPGILLDHIFGIGPDAVSSESRFFERRIGLVMVGVAISRQSDFASSRGKCWVSKVA